MSIKQLTKNGTTLYQVYVFQSSKKKRKRIQKRRVVKTKAEAKRLEKKLTLEVTREVCRMEGEGISFSELISKWYGYHTFSKYSNLGPESREDYHNALNNWFCHLLETPVSKINRSDIKDVISLAEKKERSLSFQSKLKNMINIVFKWGLDEGIIKDVSESPARGIQLRKVTEKKPEILTMKQSESLLEHAKRFNHPWYPVWSFALLSGCRNGEIFALDWSDIDFENNKVTISKSYNTRRKEIKSTKAGYFRTVPINSDLRKLLLELYSNRASDTDFVLPRLSGWHRGDQAKILRSFLTQIGLPSVKFHTLRACFATMLLTQGVPPITVMKICGWKDLDTMARYIRIAGIDEDGATDKLKLLPCHANEEIIDISSRRTES